MQIINKIREQGMKLILEIESVNNNLIDPNEYRNKVNKISLDSFMKFANEDGIQLPDIDSNRHRTGFYDIAIQLSTIESLKNKRNAPYSIKTEEVIFPGLHLPSDIEGVKQPKLEWNFNNEMSHFSVILGLVYSTGLYNDIRRNRFNPIKAEVAGLKSIFQFLNYNEKSGVDIKSLINSSYNEENAFKLREFYYQMSEFNYDVCYMRQNEVLKNHVEQGTFQTISAVEDLNLFRTRSFSFVVNN